MGQLSIEKLEHDIEITLAFLRDDLTKKQWDFYIRQYHALCIKWCQMRGERPCANYNRSEYII